jgi:hypothetical protein
VVAKLAESCLCLKGEEMPTGRQVEKTLEGVEIKCPSHFSHYTSEAECYKRSFLRSVILI